MASMILLVAAALTGQGDVKSFRHDFRGGGPQPDALRLVGPNPEAVIKSEQEGLRIVLSKETKQTRGWGVSPKFRVSGDFDNLLLGHAQTLDESVGIDIGTDAIEQVPRLAAAPGPVDHSPRASRFECEGDILGNRETRKERWLLIDSGNPECSRGRGAATSRWRITGIWSTPASCARSSHILL